MRNHLAIRSDDLVHETLEGETIIIHLGTGIYYSLTGAGAEVWGLLDVARSRQQIVAELAERHERPLADVEPAVTAFLQELLDEGLVEPSRKGAAVEGSPVWQADSWQPPKVEKFTDMELYLGEIHGGYGQALRYDFDEQDQPPADQPDELPAPRRVREPLAPVE